MDAHRSPAWYGRQWFRCWHAHGAHFDKQRRFPASSENRHPREPTVIARGKVATKLVDRDLQVQPWEDIRIVLRY